MTDEMKEIKLKADTGNRDAMLNLGVAYYKQGNKEDAEKWIYKASVEGHKTASQTMGYLYTDPSSGMQDINKFLEWIKKLAKNDNVGWGKLVLGSIYSGVGKYSWSELFITNEFLVEKDEEKGFKLITDGIEIMERSGSEWKPNEDDYFAIGGAYQNICIHRNEKGNSYLNLKINSLKYFIKELEVLDSTYSPEEKQKYSELFDMSKRMIFSIAREIKSLISAATATAAATNAINGMLNTLINNKDSAGTKHYSDKTLEDFYKLLPLMKKLMPEIDVYAEYDVSYENALIVK